MKKSGVRNQGSGIRNQESGIRGQESANDFLTPDPCLLTPDMEPERYELFEEPRYQFDPDRREFLKVAGSGILVCLVLSDAMAQQQPGRGRGRGGSGGGGPQELSARLHIAETGQVTVYTGKVEVGQGSRTSLTQVVAEELRMPVASIQ